MLDAEIIRLVDERVRASLKRPQRAGTFVQRTGEITGQVIEDGAQVAMPVLIAGDLLLYEGDRVAMCQFGADWVVIASLAPRVESEVGWSYTFAGEGVAGAFTPMPGQPAEASRVLRKRLNSTRIKVEMHATTFSDTENRTFAMGVGWTRVDTGGYAEAFVSRYRFQAGIVLAYRNWGRTHYLTGISAGDYMLTALWGNVTGSATMYGDTNCDYSFSAKESV